MHAAEPVSPLTPSPYLPVSRSLVNFTYIRPEAIEEYRLLGAESLDEIRKLFESIEPLNNKAEKIDRDVMWHAKMQALWIIFKAGRTSARQREFADFCAKSGEATRGLRHMVPMLRQVGLRRRRRHQLDSSLYEGIP